MSHLPELALCVRQPWAWAIIHARKDIENRSPKAVRYMTHRGRICIAASKTMTQDEYRSAQEFMGRFGLVCPKAADLVRGGIIGTVEVVGMVSESTSPWWMGPRGLVLRSPAACQPIPSVGQLGFYKWAPSGEGIQQAQPWMLPKMRAQPLPSLPSLPLFEGGK